MTTGENFMKVTDLVWAESARVQPLDYHEDEVFFVVFEEGNPELEVAEQVVLFLNCSSFGTGTGVKERITV